MTFVMGRTCVGDQNWLSQALLRRAGTARPTAMRGVSFAVRRGELFALLGTNGAGKTSTLEVLEGLAPPTSGVVRVLGCDPDRARRLCGAGSASCCRRGGSR